MSICSILQKIEFIVSSPQAKAELFSSFADKNVLEQLNETTCNRDPHCNYEILEKALTDSHTECFPKRIVKFNVKNTIKMLG